MQHHRPASHRVVVEGSGDDLAARIRKKAPEVADPLNKVSTTESECAGDFGTKSAGGACSSRTVLRTVRDFVISEGAIQPSTAKLNASELIDAAASVLDCGCGSTKAASEACVVSHPRVASFVVETQGGEGALKHKDEVTRAFKPPGPREGTALLSNFNIDDVAQRWGREFPQFFNCPFSMMDFERESYLFGRVNLMDVFRGEVTQMVYNPDTPRQPAATRRKCNTFGCVLNTDVSTGKGKHWVCVFVDMRGDKEWTVEYFNSAGNPPPQPMVRWMERAAHELSQGRPGGQAKAVAVSSVCHQKSRTECGLYVLYYIRSRLEGVPWSHFAEWTVPDAAMTEFRRHLFSSLPEAK